MQSVDLLTLSTSFALIAAAGYIFYGGDTYQRKVAISGIVIAIVVIAITLYAANPNTPVDMDTSFIDSLTG